MRKLLQNNSKGGKMNTKTSAKYSTKKTTENSRRENPQKLIDFNYQRATPKNDHIVILEGKFKKKVETSRGKSEERKLFSRVKLLNQINTNRTLIPDLSPPDEKQNCSRNSSIKKSNTNAFQFNKESPEFNYISNVNIKVPTKKSNPKLFSSSCFDKGDKDLPQTRTLYKPTLLEKYTKTTQIYSLPGGVKRNENEINDNGVQCKSFCGNKSKESYQHKLLNDYNSNVACLPGCEINPIILRMRKFNGKKNEGNNIFNNTTTDVPIANNSFNISHKKKINLDTHLNSNSFFGKSVTQRNTPQIRGYHNESHFEFH